jgi:hypothetical protein
MNRGIALVLVMTLALAGCSTCFIEMAPSALEPYLIDDCHHRTHK